MVNFDQISLPEIHTHHGRFRPNFALHAPLPPTPPPPSHGSVPRQPNLGRHRPRSATLPAPSGCAARLCQPLLRRLRLGLGERLRRRRRGRGRDGRAAGAALSAYASVVSVEGESSDSRQISRNFALALTLANFVSNFAKSLHRASPEVPKFSFAHSQIPPPG